MAYRLKEFIRRRFWNCYEGFIIIAIFVLPVWTTWFVIRHADQLWNGMLWEPILHRKLLFAGFAASLVICDMVGSLSKKSLAIKIRERYLGRIPVIGPFIADFNPQARKLRDNAKGALIAEYQSGWRVALLTAIHQTADGHQGSVGFFGVPPPSQMIDDDSKIKVLRTFENGKLTFKLIPTNTAWKQELSYGTTVPPHAYRNLVTITFREFVRTTNLDDSN